MNIKRAISKYFDTLVNARFKQDSDGHVIFYPYGFGAGRIVFNTEYENTLRLHSRRMLLAVFIVLIPVGSLAGFYTQLKGLSYLVIFGPAVGIAFATNVYLYWMSRHLPRAPGRLSYCGAVMQSLDHFGIKFLKFGLISSVIFIAVSALLLVIPAARAELDPIMLAISILIFAPMALLYARAIAQRKKLTAHLSGN